MYKTPLHNPPPEFLKHRILWDMRMPGLQVGPTVQARGGPTRPGAGIVGLGQSARPHIPLRSTSFVTRQPGTLRNRTNIACYSVAKFVPPLFQVRISVCNHFSRFKAHPHWPERPKVIAVKAATEVLERRRNILCHHITAGIGAE
jgi:hypothetical protein